MDNMLPNPHWDALQRDTFEVGIALLTAASSSADNGVTVRISCLYATPIYITCAACAWFRQRICEIISTKSSKTTIRENLDPRKFSAIRYSLLGVSIELVYLNIARLHCRKSVH